MNWPSQAHNPATPAGQIEQAALIAAGIRAPRRGWQRVVADTGFTVLALCVLLSLAALFLRRG